MKKIIVFTMVLVTSVCMAKNTGIDPSLYNLMGTFVTKVQSHDYESTTIVEGKRYYTYCDNTDKGVECSDDPGGSYYIKSSNGKNYSVFPLPVVLYSGDFDASYTGNRPTLFEVSDYGDFSFRVANGSGPTNSNQLYACVPLTKIVKKHKVETQVVYDEVCYWIIHE